VKPSWKIPSSKLFVCPSAFLQRGIAESEKTTEKEKQKNQNPYSFLWYKHKICLKRRSASSCFRSKAMGVKLAPAVASCPRPAWGAVMEQAARLVPCPRRTALPAHAWRGTRTPHSVPLGGFTHPDSTSLNFAPASKPYSSGHYSYSPLRSA